MRISQILDTNRVWVFNSFVVVVVVVDSVQVHIPSKNSNVEKSP